MEQAKYDMEFTTNPQPVKRSTTPDQYKYMRTLFCDTESGYDGSISGITTRLTVSEASDIISAMKGGNRIYVNRG